MRTICSTLLLPSLLIGARAATIHAPEISPSPKREIVRNPIYPLDDVDKLEEATMPNVDEWLGEKISAGHNNGCTMENAVVRQEWSDMSVTQRQDYVAAVTCLMKLPPTVNLTRFSGAQSRYDDFVAYHMTHAMQLHDNLHLFGAHKYFVWLFEKALRDECGYTGYQPYMNYDRYARDPFNSPLLNGNSSSMGSTGVLEPTYKGIPQPGRTPNIIKSNGGGGCAKEGPFSDIVVSLGPTSTTIGTNLPKNPRADGTGPNPRCLRRDVNKDALMGATADHVFNLISKSNDINSFYNTLLGMPAPKNDSYPWGVHTAGHYVAAVDPGGDPMTSPGDPLFYFHHTSLDRIWWIWQMQDVEKRLYVLPNASMPMPMPNGSMSTMPGSRMPMLRRRAPDPQDVIVDMEWLGPPIKLFETHDQLGGNDGKFCYIYV